MEQDRAVVPDPLSEEDLQLVNALQINPRASWDVIGSALKWDASTARRRWARLVEERLAWVTPALGPVAMSQICRVFVELQVAPGMAERVAAELALEPRIVTVNHVAGEYDLWAIVFADRFSTMSSFLLTDLPAFEGVVKVRSHFVTRYYRRGSQWRLQALDAAGYRDLAPDSRHGDWRAGSGEDTVLRQMLKGLAPDGRMSAQALGEILGVMPRTAQRRLTRLVNADALVLRCDVARPLAGWPTGAVLWIRVPDDRLDEAGAALSRRADVRSCAAVAGAMNLLVTTTLHSVDALHDWVIDARRELPYIEIEDRAVILRQQKLCGHVLDAWGRSDAVVPMDFGGR